jgi:aryl-alcohol dehydrogenase-like predicted oxidoreductase
VKLRKLGRTGLDVSPIAFGGATITYTQKSTGWNPRSDEGRQQVIDTLNYAIDRGINYIDTSPLYGDGYSEEMIGEVMKSRRKDCVLASKSWYEHDKQGTIDSVHASLKRLNTDYIDVLQIHGRMYQPAEVEHIMKEGGPLDGLRQLKAEGKIGHIGITSEEPWTLIPFLALPEVEVFQIAYNFIYQAAARHFLLEAAKVNAGVVTMRTMTSGILQLQASYFAPEWQAAHDLYDVALKFVLSDSRVHSGIIGIRWKEEVDRNLGVVEGWTPPVDIAEMPRMTFKVYEAEDSK